MATLSELLFKLADFAKKTYLLLLNLAEVNLNVLYVTDLIHNHLRNHLITNKHLILHVALQVCNTQMYEFAPSPPSAFSAMNSIGTH